MSEEQQEKATSVDELLEAVRQLKAQDAEGFRRLVEKISRDASLELSREVITLARVLGYEEADLLDAVDGCGLVRTFGFLQREVERKSRAQVPTTVH